jgi:hypothetical protein
MGRQTAALHKDRQPRAGLADPGSRVPLIQHDGLYIFALVVFQPMSFWGQCCYIALQHI